MKNTATAPQASWAVALRRFDADLRRRGAADRLRRAYAADLAELATWALAQRLAPTALTDGVVRGYVARLPRRRLAATRAFLRSLAEHGDIAASPLDLLPAPAPPVPIAPVSALELRDRALLELAVARGLGAEVLVRLDVAGAPRAAAVTAYLERGRPALVGAGGDPALFLSKSGRRLSTSDVRRRLRLLPATRVYTRIESARLRAAYLRSHPRA